LIKKLTLLSAWAAKW